MKKPIKFKIYLFVMLSNINLIESPNHSDFFQKEVFEKKKFLKKRITRELKLLIFINIKSILLIIFLSTTLS
jgi:hypothetical protein